MIYVSQVQHNLSRDKNMSAVDSKLNFFVAKTYQLIQTINSSVSFDPWFWFCFGKRNFVPTQCCQTKYNDRQLFTLWKDFIIPFIQTCRTDLPSVDLFIYLYKRRVSLHNVNRAKIHTEESQARIMMNGVWNYLHRQSTCFTSKSEKDRLECQEFSLADIKSTGHRIQNPLFVEVLFHNVATVYRPTFYWSFDPANERLDPVLDIYALGEYIGILSICSKWGTMETSKKSLQSSCLWWFEKQKSSLLHWSHRHCFHDQLQLTSSWKMTFNSCSSNVNVSTLSAVFARPTLYWSHFKTIPHVLTCSCSQP